MRNLAGFCVKSMIAVFGIVSLTLMGPNSVSAEEATKYSPDSTAILMVDPFNDFISEGGVLWPWVQEVAEHVNLVANLKRLAEGARAKGVQIIYTPHRRWREGDYDNWQFSHPQHGPTAEMKLFEAGAWGGEWHPDLTPQPGDEVSKEHWLSAAFPNTDVDYLLRQHGIDHVVVVGLTSNTCVESTARFAVEMGYHTTLLTDAVATFSMEEHKAAVELDYPRIAHNVTTVDGFLASVE